MKTFQKSFLSIALLVLVNTGSISATNNQSTDNHKNDSLAVLTRKAEAGDAAAQNTLGNWYYIGKNVEKDYAKAAGWWSKSAKQENVDGVGNLAICYQLGRGVKADSAMALKLYEKAITLGNKAIIPQHEKLVEKNQSNLFSAQLLYQCYKKGIGVKVSEEKANKYKELLTEKGDAENQFLLALDYLNRKESKKAVEWFKKAMRQGHVGATFYLGRLIFQGMGIDQDKLQGIKLMEKAAKTNFPGACLELGKIYLKGDGTEKDSERAVSYLKRVAGINGEAGWILANCYLNGEGVNQDYFFASQWMAEYAISHKNEIQKLFEEETEVPFSQYLMGLQQLFIYKNYDSAISLFKKVEKAKHLEGVMMTGICYAQQDYSKQNAKKAAKLMARASEQIPAAKYYLSSFYEKGEGVKKDIKKSVELLKEAAEGGVGCAQCALGDKYMTGDVVEKDYVKAAKLYLEAEAQRQLSPQAAQNLAECYRRGVATLPDLSNAKERIESLIKHVTNDRLNGLLKMIEE